MLTNIQIEEMIQKGLISIDPFVHEKLEANHYRLCIDSIKKRREDESTGYGLDFKTYDFSEGDFLLNPNEYAVVVIKEKIILGKGMFGEFYSASLNVENGLILNCGRLNSFYKKEIHFGLFNAGPAEYRLVKGQEIARVIFNYVGESTPIDYEKKSTNIKYLAMIDELRKTESKIIDLEKKRNDLTEKLGGK